MTRASALRPGLLVEEGDGELLVVDPASGQAHLLKGDAADAYRACAAGGDLASDEGLGALAAAGLLEAGPSRRLMLQGAAIAVGAGLVTTLSIPAAAAAVSGGAGTGSGGITPGSISLSSPTNVQMFDGSNWVAATPYNNENYVAISGTSFVGGENGVVGDYQYRIPFSIPAGFATVSVTGSMRADNGVDAFVNGAAAGSQPTTGTAGNFQGGSDGTISYTGAPGTVVSGTNYLEFTLHNAGGPYGLDFKATVNYS